VFCWDAAFSHSDVADVDILLTMAGVNGCLTAKALWPADTSSLPPLVIPWCSKDLCAENNHAHRRSSDGV
jgi:hypothetical protein